MIIERVSRKSTLFCRLRGICALWKLPVEKSTQDYTFENYCIANDLYTNTKWGYLNSCCT